MLSIIDVRLKSCFDLKGLGSEFYCCLLVDVGYLKQQRNSNLATSGYPDVQAQNNFTTAIIAKEEDVKVEIFMVNDCLGETVDWIHY